MRKSTGLREAVLEQLPDGKSTISPSPLGCRWIGPAGIAHRRSFFDRLICITELHTPDTFSPTESRTGEVGVPRGSRICHDRPGEEVHRLRSLDWWLDYFPIRRRSRGIVRHALDTNASVRLNLLNSRDQRSAANFGGISAGRTRITFRRELLAMLLDMAGANPGHWVSDRSGRINGAPLRANRGRRASRSPRPGGRVIGFCQQDCVRLVPDAVTPAGSITAQSRHRRRVTCFACSMISAVNKGSTSCSRPFGIDSSYILSAPYS